MYAAVLLIVFAIFSNVVLPLINTKVQQEKKMIASLVATTNPVCFIRYLATITYTIRGIDFKVGFMNTGNPASCKDMPDRWQQCSGYELTNQHHPCSFVLSNMRTTYLLTS